MLSTFRSFGQSCCCSKPNWMRMEDVWTLLPIPNLRLCPWQLSPTEGVSSDRCRENGLTWEPSSRTRVGVGGWTPDSLFVLGSKKNKSDPKHKNFSCLTIRREFPLPIYYHLFYLNENFCGNIQTLNWLNELKQQNGTNKNLINEENTNMVWLFLSNLHVFAQLLHGSKQIIVTKPKANEAPLSHLCKMS